MTSDSAVHETKSPPSAEHQSTTKKVDYNPPEASAATAALASGQISPGTPRTGSDNWNVEERRFHRCYLWSQWSLVAITIVGIAVAICSLRSLNNSVAASNQQAAAAATQARLAVGAQRPFISFGGPDGKVAEYIKPKKMQSKGAIVLYFQNGGTDVAINTRINAYSMNNPDRVTFRAQHLLRYTFTYQDHTAQIGSSGLTVTAHSVFTVPLSEEWVPTPEQWEKIQAGKWGGGFFVAGTFEYCDKLGQYRCDGFNGVYEPPPIDRFVLGDPMPCVVLPPTLAEVPEPNRNRVRFLSRCEQPNERSPYEAAN